MAPAHVNVPTRGNRKLEALLEAANADDQLKGWWYMAQTNADRLGDTELRAPACASLDRLCSSP